MKIVDFVLAMNNYLWYIKILLEKIQVEFGYYAWNSYMHLYHIFLFKCFVWLLLKSYPL